MSMTILTLRDKLWNWSKKRKSKWNIGSNYRRFVFGNSTLRKNVVYQLLMYHAYLRAISVQPAVTVPAISVPALWSSFLFMNRFNVAVFSRASIYKFYFRPICTTYIYQLSPYQLPQYPQPYVFEQPTVSVPAASVPTTICLCTISCLHTSCLCAHNHISLNNQLFLYQLYLCPQPYVFLQPSVSVPAASVPSGVSKRVRRCWN